MLDNLTSGEATALPIGARLIKGDIRNADVVAEAMQDCEAVVHLAAVSSWRPAPGIAQAPRT